MLRAARSTAATAVVALLAGLVVVVSSGVASAEPVDPLFTDRIDDHADYDGADGCSPGDKPGAVALKDLVLAAYPGTTGSISRACAGGSSEHYEGRALDWMVSADTQRPLADDLFRWLLAGDAYGNKHAMARRFGVMYIIFDHEIWRAYDADEGWRPYSGSNPHTDHVHISMSWDGALRETTWFTGGESGLLLDQARFAATWRGPEHLDVLRRSTSGDLEQRTWVGGLGWGVWEDVGGSLTSGPAAVWAGKTLWVFAQGEAGTLEQRRWRSSSGWEAWEDTGILIEAAPGVASLRKRVDLVVVTPTSTAAHRSWRPRSGWSAWKELGGLVTTPPAVVWTSPDQLDVFVRGGNARLYQQTRVDGTWSGWLDLGGVLTSAPAATSFIPGRIDVFVRSNLGSISHRYESGAGWSSWLELGGRHVSGPTASPRDATRIDVFTRDREARLRQNFYISGTGWTGWGAP